MRRVSQLLFVLFLCVSSVLAVHAQTARNVRVDFKETTLKNGLRVITVEDHSAPVIAVALTYNVGSRNERQGRTGFAHLFEHMMFKGSENVGSGEHFMLVFNNGGTMNGSTNEDRTNYFEALPANQLDLALFLEADRMKSLAITKDNLDNQRNAVQEERRLGVDNQAYGKSGEIQQQLIYDNFAYKHTTIGSMEDLNAASVEDVSQFFKMYYAPNNAVLTLVGDFKTAEALAKVRANFESIPRQPDPPIVDMTEPQQKAERRASVDDVLARAPRIDIAYKSVAGN
ncbi:MAG TPA: pitrilysin family protein, partial [Pyrinomonadaceae bacterium]|nr:pitrilysin family protein [Pyrinomonadaceae bacterium]